MAKKRKKPFKYLGATALGLGGLGLTVGVSSAVAGQAAAGTPAAAAMGGFTTIAQAAPIATTAGVGYGLLNQVRQLNKPKKRRRK